MNNMPNNRYHLNLEKIIPKNSKLDNDTIMDDSEDAIVCEMIQNVSKLREKWLCKPHNQKNHGCRLDYYEIMKLVSDLKNNINIEYNVDSNIELKFDDGVCGLYDVSENKEIYKYEELTVNKYLKDLNTVLKLASDGPAKTMCYKRLKILEGRFKLHLYFNNDSEMREVSQIPYRYVII